MFIFSIVVFLAIFFVIKERRFSSSLVYHCLHFTDVILSFAPRSCNSMAHALAAFGASRQLDKQLWLEDLSSNIHVTLTNTIAESGN
jgi:hypothetical protein